MQGAMTGMAGRDEIQKKVLEYIESKLVMERWSTD